MVLATATLIAGLLVLYLGGHYLVQGATRIALLARMSASVVGLTVVAMGTSLPELAVSVNAAAKGATDLAYGNIVGSTIFNIGAVLGVSALFFPLAVKRRTIQIEYPFLFVVSCVVLLLCRDRNVDRLEGGFLVLALILFTGFVVYVARRDVAADEAVVLEREVQRAAKIERGVGRAWGVNIMLVVLGIVALVAGADLIVRGAVTIATALGVDERIIGLTVVAMGTSLPELAASVIASRQGEQEIALANVIGSNVFDLLGVLGVTALIFPVPIHAAAATLDNWVMLGFCGALFPVMYFERRVSRLDGLILIFGFSAYIAYLALARSA